MRHKRLRLPLLPLLRAYAGATLPVSELGPRAVAIRSASAGLLNEAFLETASPADFAARLAQFYEICVQPPLQSQLLRRRAGLLRHALGHLRHRHEPLAIKASRCLRSDGAYHIPGLGLSFWSALFQALDPDRVPGATPAILTGLRRLGLDDWPADADASRIYAHILSLWSQFRERVPTLTAQHLDHFLTLVAFMEGRDLWSARAHLAQHSSGIDLESLIRQERIRLPLRRRLTEQSRALEQARTELEAALATQDGPRLGGALAVADPVSHRRAPLDWLAEAEELTLWIGRLWEAEDPYEILELFWSRQPIPGAGLWLPAAVLHLRDPRRFLPWSEETRRGYRRLDDARELDLSPGPRYRLYNEGMTWLGEHYRLHPLEQPGLLTSLASGSYRGSVSAIADDAAGTTRFRGFCPDTFAFLRELADNNRRDWLDGQRDRYRFAVRQPLIELCRALGERYVKPVLRQTHGWNLEQTPRSGHALTSIVKNDYGRSQPYHTTLWITFYRRASTATDASADANATGRGRREDVQFFVRLDATGLSYGLRLGREAREAGRLLRRNVQEYAEPLFHALCHTGAAADCLFTSDAGPPATLTSAADLRTWAAGKALTASRTLPAHHPLLASDDLVGEILLTFDRLLPAYASAVQSDPRAFLTERTRGASRESRFTTADFTRHTHLDEAWLSRARELLELKRQLILQGVPGTGKTFVARNLARWLTRGHEANVRLVQFHPAYTYEEFVEGIKVKSIEREGRSDVIYPVEDGVLCSFAAEAARRPTEPFVLIVDEINRGHLPRVFGELLYLLEYRDQTVVLPYSRRAFRLPPNLYLLATMNAADRSVTQIDQALRRRFSFLEMPPDVGVLTAWYRKHPPISGPEYTEEVVRLFQILNRRLQSDLGPQWQVGHSYFMVPELDEAKLRVIWEHQIWPLLQEYFTGQSERLTSYELERLRDSESGEKRRPRSATRTLA